MSRTNPAAKAVQTAGLPDVQVTVRRKPFWRPVLRPGSGRRLPRHLLPEAVYEKGLAIPEGLVSKKYESLIRQIDRSPFHNDTQVEVFTVGVEAFERILTAINEAREEILIEAYVLRDDRTGRDLQKSLEAAVARGVDVKVLADSFGSSHTGRDFWVSLRKQGSHVRLFRRPRYAPPGLIPIIDHRKLIIVDRRIAFTGGMNIADEYRHGRQGEQAWRDTHVCLQGDIVWELVVIFAESWTAAGGDLLQFEGLSPSSRHGSKTLVLDARPGRGQNEVFSAYAATLGAARSHVYITNAYFAPGRKMVRLLKKTAARGVEVKLLLPGQCDIPVIRTATQGYYRELLQAGIRIYEYQASVLHAKTLVADGSVAIIGSTNFDFRSFNFNAECNVLMHEKQVAEHMEAVFDDDLQKSSEVTLESWRARPLSVRLLAWLARKIAFVM